MGTVSNRHTRTCASSQGYTFASDSGCEDENESHPSPCISITSNSTRKRVLSEDTYQYTTVGTQTTPRNSAVGHDHRDQMTQWSTPDLYQQRATEDNKKENTGGTSTTTLLDYCVTHAGVIGVNDRQSIVARSVPHHHIYGT